ncbi:28501_t:CDS:1, partial [Gigaspora margarita]
CALNQDYALLYKGTNEELRNVNVKKNKKKIKEKTTILENKTYEKLESQEDCWNKDYEKKSVQAKK